jgi:hypothetical protein
MPICGIRDGKQEETLILVTEAVVYPLLVPIAEECRHHTVPSPVNRWDVYVDDFIGMVQVNWLHHWHVKIVLLSSLDFVLRRLEAGDSEYHQEPASVKKMMDGGATWMSHTLILGWHVDTVSMTIQLPLDTIGLQKQRTTVIKWQNMLGELHSMVWQSQVTRDCSAFCTMSCARSMMKV